jgi:hypothetical protein
MSAPDRWEELDMDFEKAVVVERFTDKAFAEAAVSLLGAEGIDAVISADDAGGVLPNLDFASGARLLVAAEDLERAKALLDANADDDGA